MSRPSEDDARRWARALLALYLIALAEQGRSYRELVAGLHRLAELGRAAELVADRPELAAVHAQNVAELDQAAELKRDR